MTLCWCPIIAVTAVTYGMSAGGTAGLVATMVSAASSSIDVSYGKMNSVK